MASLEQIFNKFAKEVESTNLNMVYIIIILESKRKIKDWFHSWIIRTFFENLNFKLNLI